MYIPGIFSPFNQRMGKKKNKKKKSVLSRLLTLTTNSPCLESVAHFREIYENNVAQSLGSEGRDAHLGRVPVLYMIHVCIMISLSYHTGPWKNTPRRFWGIHGREKDT